MHFQRFLAVLFAITVFFAFSYARDSNVIRGPRPPIDISAVPDDAMEPGRLRIFVSEDAGKAFDTQPVRVSQDAVAFGIPELDAAGSGVALHNAVPSFSGPALQTRHTERHRAWGLHRWYDLYIDQRQDVRAAVELFQSLESVDIAEPVYRKELIVGETFEWEEAIPGTSGRDDGWIPDDPQFGNQWHYHNTGQSGGTAGADIRLPQAWEIETGSPDVIVAIVDDGIQFSHPDLAANMWDDVGFNFVNNSPNVNPGDHGTHVAGTVAAVTNNGVGVAGIAGGTGAGNGVRLMSAQVFDGLSSGGFHLAPVYAADNGAAISQNSWGYTSAGVFEQAVLDAIDYFNANGGGDVMDGGITIFAAGNSNADGDWYPGFYEGAFSVAATNHSDQKAAYSNYGTWIDISAPGGETTVSNNRGVLSTVTGSSYAYYQGTSMACPHVSGAAALVLSYAPGTLTSQELWDLLVESADNHYDANPNFQGLLGSGRLNAHQALLEAGDILAGLVNPSGFQAVAAGPDAIQLGWNLNPGGDNVLLAYSEDGSFGDPTGTYGPGDEIPGGGTVLLTGTQTAFAHDGLTSSTTYYYRIWSIHQGEYSSGRGSSAATWCDIFQMPFSEDFSGGGIPLCWETVAGSGNNWTVGPFSGGLNIDGPYAFSGTGLVFGSQNANLISPIIDMSNQEEVVVSFAHYFRTSWIAGGTATFLYSLDNGNSWTSVASWSSTTANPATFEAEIPELAGEPTVTFRWNMSYGFAGYYWTVGQVSVAGTDVGEDPVFSVSFNVVDEQGAPVPDATVSLGNLVNAAGDYFFEELEPGNYPYLVVRECNADVVGHITIDDQDVVAEAVLETVPGDANGDGVVDVLDVLSITEYFGNPLVEPFCFDNADINGDGTINVLDLIEVVNQYTGH